MKINKVLVALSFGLGLTLALLWLISGGSAVRAAPTAELHVCPSGCDYSSVQAAVDAANPDDVIKVAQGEYTDIHQRGGITQVVYISKTVILRGGYTTTNWDTPDPGANPTTLDAQGLGRVLYITGDISPTIAGLHLTGGDAVGLGGDPWGDAGGGVYVIGAVATLSGNDIYNNTAGSGGGGVFLGIDSNNATLSGNDIYNNTANWSGGVCVWGSDDAMLSSNHIYSNAANLDAGGVFLGGYSDNVTLSGNDVHNNTAGDDGGGVLVRTDDATLSSNHIYGNTANDDGGGIQLDLSDDVTLDNNVIADNQANDNGSGLYVRISTADLRHNTIARNTGGDGSGIHITDNNSAVTLTNNILVSHTVGITVTAGNTATLESTLWGSNAWANDTDRGGAGTINTTNDYTGDPAFVNPTGGDYHIGAGSAAIDQGVNAGVTTDIDGDSRPIGAGYDIGADEFTLRHIYLPLVLRDG